MTSRRARIARLRQVALAGLGPYALPEGRLTFVSHGENTTARQRGRAAPRACAPAPAARLRHRLSGGYPLRALLASGDQGGHRLVRPGGTRGSSRSPTEVVSVTD